MPVMHSNMMLKKSLQEGIENGTLNIGVPVIKKEFTKLTISAQREIEQKKCHLQVGKIPFKDIRKHHF